MDGMDVNTIANLAMILAFAALFANILLAAFLERLGEYADKIWGTAQSNSARINRLEQEIDNIQKLEDPWNHMKNW